MDFICELTSLIPRLPCLLRMAKAVSSTINQVNSVTFHSVNSFNFGMWTFASKCFPIELVLCAEGWRRISWQTLPIMPGMPVSSNPQCNQNCHNGKCLESFEAERPFEPTFIQAHQAWKMMCKVRSLKSWINRWLFLEEIITSSNEVMKDFEANVAVGSRNVGNSAWVTTKSTVIGM